MIGVIAAHEVLGGGGGGTLPAGIDAGTLRMWASAQAESYTDGATATTLTDWSGLANHGTRPGGAVTWETDQGPSAGPAFVLEGGYWTLPSGVFSGATEGTVAIHCRPRVNTQGFWNMGGAADISHFPYSNTLYDGALTTSRPAIYGSVALDSTWYRYIVRCKAGQWQAYLNGTSMATMTSHVVSLPSAPIIGAWSTPSPSWVFRSRVTTFLATHKWLSDAQVGQLDAWMVANPSGGTP